METNILSSPELGSSIGTVVPAHVAVVITPTMTMKNAVENTVVSLDGPDSDACCLLHDSIPGLVLGLLSAFAGLLGPPALTIEELKKNGFPIILNLAHRLMGFKPFCFMVVGRT